MAVGADSGAVGRGRGAATEFAATLGGRVFGLFPHPADDLCDIRPADPARQLARVLVAQSWVLDLGDDRYATTQCGHPALGVVQVHLAQRRANRELEQRSSPRNQIAQRAFAGRQPQIAGIHAVGRDRDEGLAGQMLLTGERLERRCPACFVAVEHIDQFTAKEVVVHHESAQHRHVFVAECGATRCHRRRHPGQVHRHHVGVALDDDGLMPFGDIAFGQVDPEQRRRLLVQQRLWSVDVLGFHRIIVEQPSCPEPDHLSGRRADRPQQPAVEPIDRATPTLPRQARSLQLLELKPLAQQMFCQRIPARRRKAAAEVTGGVGVEIPLGQVFARGLRLRRIPAPPRRTPAPRRWRRAAGCDSPGHAARWWPQPRCS